MKTLFTKNHSLQTNVDWLLLFFLLPIMAAGLVTMKSFLPVDGGIGGNIFFQRQLIWILISLIIFFVFSRIDFRFLKKTNVLVTLYLIFAGFLLLLFVFGDAVKGATSWFDFGGFSFQPADVMKLVVVLMLAKYFSRRHVEIANIKHIFVSGLHQIVFLFLKNCQLLGQNPHK